MNKFYIMPLNQVMLLMAVGVFAWAGMKRIVNKSKRIEKWWRYANVIMFVGAFFLIMRMTLFGRVPGEREIIWQPFYTLMTMSYNNEAVRTMVMNIVLFLPFGLTSPYVFWKLKDNFRRRFLCILLGCLLSIGVELLQYCFALGQAEMDDVICNTLGCGLGVFADWLGRNVNAKQRVP